MTQTTPLKITPAFMDYDWGYESDCWVSSLRKETRTNPQYFAEVWYGDHIDGPAVLVDDPDTNLRQLIDQQTAEMLGSTAGMYLGRMPFLAKVLSVGKPLSIQLHPKEDDAILLNKEKPDIYRDPFAKDEGSVALSNVELLYGFCNSETLETRLKRFPVLKRFLNEELPSPDSSNYVQNFFSQIWEHEKNEDLIEEVCIQLRNAIAIGRHKPDKVELWALELVKERYPKGNIGVIAMMAMDYVHIPSGSGLFIPTGVPHAYLSGQLLEIMKPSNNVIRCGLTTKLCDWRELLKCADFNHGATQVVEPDADGLITLGNIFNIQLLRADMKIEQGNIKSPEILLCLDGDATLSYGDTQMQLDTGDAVFIPGTCMDYSLVSNNRTVRFYLAS